MNIKLSFVILSFFVSQSLAVNVFVAKVPLQYEEKLDIKKLEYKNIPRIQKRCIPLKLSQIQNNEYLTTHYINKNSIICLRDIVKYKNNSVKFNFGNLQIEKKGKIIYENDEFIRIKNLNGKIEKIYKDGRVQ